MTLDAAMISTLSGWLDATDIDGLELSGPQGSLRLVRGKIASQPLAHPQAQGASVVTAQSVGVFLDRCPLASEPAATVGDQVAAGALIGCLRVGPLLLPVRAPSDGVVAERLQNPGQSVGFGAPLFRLEALLPGEAS